MNAQVIALVNQKGGVGKSKTCANLGVELSQAEKGCCWWTVTPSPAVLIGAVSPFKKKELRMGTIG